MGLTSVSGIGRGSEGWMSRCQSKGRRDLGVGSCRGEGMSGDQVEAQRISVKVLLELQRI